MSEAAPAAPEINFGLLKRLCETPAVPGREEQLREVLRAVLAERCDSVETDVLGNVIGRRRGTGTGPRVMLAAHMDEIGFFVRHIDDKGFLRLQPVGGFDARVLVAQRVLVHGYRCSEGPLRGVLSLATKPIHLLSAEEAKPPKLEEFFVDVGLPAERARELAEVGDPVTLDRTVERAGECAIGKAMDDRAGVYVLVEALRLAERTAAEIVAVATAQEEIGSRGAMAAAYHLEPTVAIALDVTLAVDIPGGSEHERVTQLGKGPAIKLMDSSSVSHPKLVRHVRDLAERAGIPYQLEVLPRGGTDAGPIQRSRGGVPTLTLSIPTRYVHTVNEMVHLRDLAQAVQLLALFLEDAHRGDYRW